MANFLICSTYLLMAPVVLSKHFSYLTKFGAAAEDKIWREALMVSGEPYPYPQNSPFSLNTPEAHFALGVTELEVEGSGTVDQLWLSSV